MRKHHENLLGTHLEQILAKGERGKEKSLGIMPYFGNMLKPFV
jgi:hypothetical protein